MTASFVYYDITHRNLDSIDRAAEHNKGTKKKEAVFGRKKKTCKNRLQAAGKILTPEVVICTYIGFFC